MTLMDNTALVDPFIIKECITVEDIRFTFEVMKQLRTHFINSEQYVDTVQRLMKNEKYKLVALYYESKCVGVAGYQMQERLSVGHILYLADLVIDEAWRRHGIGKKLLDYLEEKARSQQAARVILESAVTRELAHKFYKALGYTADSLSFRRNPNIPRS